MKTQPNEAAAHRAASPKPRDPEPARRSLLAAPGLTLPVLGVAVMLGLWLAPAAPTPALKPVSNSDQIDYPSWQLASADDTSLPMPTSVLAAPSHVSGGALPSAQLTRLPPETQAALAQIGVGAGEVSVVVQAAGEPQVAPLLAVEGDTPRNPASATKLFTTFAALDLLGPAWRWQTPVWLQGTIDPSQGVLKGNLVVQGQGDPQLVVERLWLALWPLWQQGVRRIDGDIILDNHAFNLPVVDPGAFDGEAARSYNVQPDALLMNYKAVTLAFTPRPVEGVVQVEALPPLAGLNVPATVPLSSGPCGDWQGKLGRQTSAAGVKLSGSYALSCGVRQWSYALDPQHYNARAIQGLWKSMGGTITGQVRAGRAPSTPPTWSLSSPTVAEVVRNVNKYSNNVMAQQIFLTLALQQQRSQAPHGVPQAGGTGGDEPERETAPESSSAAGEALPSVTLAQARTTLEGWMQRRLGFAPGSAVIDSGSGLSRQTRISANQFTQLLQTAWRSPVMPEFVSSLPLVGVDGTLRKSQAQPQSAHLKTGTLRGVKALAGYVRGRNGRTYTLVALVNGPGAEQAAHAFDTLIDWVSRQD